MSIWLYIKNGKWVAFTEVPTGPHASGFLGAWGSTGDSVWTVIAELVRGVPR